MMDNLVYYLFFDIVVVLKEKKYDKIFLLMIGSDIWYGIIYLYEICIRYNYF